MSYYDDWEDGDSSFWENYMGGDDYDDNDEFCLDNDWQDFGDFELEYEDKSRSAFCCDETDFFYPEIDGDFELEAKYFVSQQNETDRHDFCIENLYDEVDTFTQKELVCVGVCFCLMTSGRLFFSPSLGNPFFNPGNKDLKYIDLYSRCKDDFNECSAPILIGKLMPAVDISRQPSISFENKDQKCIDGSAIKIDELSESPAQILLRKLISN